jgi:hypothetical protein
MGIYVKVMQTVAETPVFTETAERVLRAAGRSDVVAYLAANPEAGDLIPGTGGIRKLRWRARGKGTRGGARVIYYVYDVDHPILALLVYGKGEADDLSPAGKRQLAAMVAEVKAAWKGK